MQVTYYPPGGAVALKSTQPVPIYSRKTERCIIFQVSVTHPFV